MFKKTRTFFTQNKEIFIHERNFIIPFIPDSVNIVEEGRTKIYFKNMERIIELSI